MIHSKTPKQQAKELILIYCQILDHIMVTNKVYECAQIAVTKIIEVTGSKYWYDVLYEINKYKPEKKSK